MTANDRLDTRLPIGFATHPWKGQTLRIHVSWECVSSADGSSSSHFVCMGQVCVDGKCINTTIDIQPANIILLGTKLLKELGKTFILDCRVGKIEIVDSPQTT